MKTATNKLSKSFVSDEALLWAKVKKILKKHGAEKAQSFLTDERSKMTFTANTETIRL